MQKKACDHVDKIINQFLLRNIFTEDFTFVSCKKNQKWKRSDFIKMGMSELKVLKSFNEKFKNIVKTRREKSLPQKNIKYFTS